MWYKIHLIYMDRITLIFSFLLRVQERGTLDRILAKWTEKYQDCPDDHDQRLGYNEILGIFVILALGAGVSGALLVGEGIFRYL